MRQAQLGTAAVRVVALVVLSALGLLSSAGAAEAVEVDEVVEALDTNRAYAEDGASLSDAQVRGIAEAFAQDGALYGVVVLADNPEQGPTILADDLAAQVTSVDTVTVIAPNGIGVGTVAFDTDDVDAALDAAEAAFNSSDDAGALVDVGNALHGTDVTTDAVGEAAAPIEEATAGSFPWVLVALVAFFVLGFLFLARRSKRTAAEQQAARVEAARDEVREDLTVMADHILDLDAQVTISDDTLLRRRYDEAAAIYRRALDEVEATSDIFALRELDEEVELARWHLESVDAILDGRPEPELPAPEPPATPPPPPAPAQQPAPPRPAPSRRTEQYPDWAREEARRRQTRRRASWGGMDAGSVLGGVLGGILGGGRRRGGMFGGGGFGGGGFGGGFGGGSMFPGGGRSRGGRSRSGGSRSRSSGGGGRRRTTGRGGRSR